MKNNFYTLIFILVGTYSFASTSIDKGIELYSNTKNEKLVVCTVATTRTISAADGNSYTVTVSNTRSTCFAAWRANDSELNKFESGVQPAK